MVFVMGIMAIFMVFERTILHFILASKIGLSLLCKLFVKCKSLQILTPLHLAAEISHLKIC